MIKKEKKIQKKLYDQLLNNQKQLKNYLTYIRLKQNSSKSVADNSTLVSENKLSSHSFSNVKNYQTHTLNSNSSNANKSNQVYLNVQKYLKTLREIMAMESYSSKKILKKTLEFLEEFPSMNFLYEVINSFGKDQKKLSMNEHLIMSYVTDQMVPLFQKIIQKIQQLRKEYESKKLMELGHRIQHLTAMVDNSKNYIPNSGNSQNTEIVKIFKKFQADRIQKYLVMEDNILKAEKRFGNFSENFIKNREVFSNLNRVYQDIKKHEK